MALSLGQIHAMDCVKGLAKLKSGSVNLAFADPPFNIGYEYDVYDDRKARQDYLDWSDEWIGAVHKILADDGAFWLAIGDEYAAELKIAAHDAGFTCRNWVIWYYTFGVHCKSKFTRSHAHLFYFVKNPKKFTFNDSVVRVPSARQLVYRDKRADKDGRVPDDTWMIPPQLPDSVPMREGFVLRPQDIPDRFAHDNDVWFFSRVAGTFAERRGWHGCQMPEQLLGRIIRACSNKGDVVLDPFGGSGTTLAVAKKLERQFVGFEYSKAYAKKINERLTSIHAGDELIGPVRPELSAPPTTARRAAKHPKSSRPPCISPVVTKVNATLGQVAVANGEYATAIAEAFMASHQGYSADRVVADPELNEQFVVSCEKLMIPGGPADWNHRLLNLRKSGGLASVETSRRTRVSSADFADCVYASEVAWRLLSDRYDESLDGILCDPDHARLFDQIAGRVAPGQSSLEYRWAALALRKMLAFDKQFARIRAKLDPRNVALEARATLPTGPAHYLVSVSGDALYVGFAENLANCLFLEPARVESAAEVLGVRDYSLRDVRIGFQRCRLGHLEKQQARRAYLVSTRNPKGNVVVGTKSGHAA